MFGCLDLGSRGFGVVGPPAGEGEGIDGKV